MANFTAQRREQELQRAISMVIEGLDDGQIVLPTIVDVRLTNDYSHAKIFVTFYKKPQYGLQQLDIAKSRIKRELALYLKWRKMPDIHFMLDTVTDEGNKIDRILNQLKDGGKLSKEADGSSEE